MSKVLFMWKNLFEQEKSTDVDTNLLYILAPNQKRDSVQNPFSVALEEISEHMDVRRAEIELKRMVRQLMVMTGGAVYSPLMLSTLGLPYPITIVLWVTATVFAEDDSNKEIDRFVQKRNHDSVKLLRSLNEYRQFLGEWWQTNVQQTSSSTLPENIKFPVGHPLPPKLYRQHPLPSKQDYYYPVNAFYTLLYEEREQELIRLLADLGATRISVYPLTAHPNTTEQFIQRSGDIPSDTKPRVFQYPERSISTIHFDASQYPWLAHEPSWQTVVESRVKYSCLSASLEINLDIAGAIVALLDGIESLSEQLTSVKPMNISALGDRILQKHRVEIEFTAY